MVKGVIMVFSSPSIAKEINRRYSNGMLDPAFFAGATQEDLLRFAKGCYERFGDGKKLPVVNMANAPEKLSILGTVLVRLGCTEVRIYNTGSHFVPTSFVLFFSPSPLVKERLGVRDGIRLDQLPDRYLAGALQLQTKIPAEK